MPLSNEPKKLEGEETTLKIYRGYLTKFLMQKGCTWGLGLFASEDNDKSQIRIKGHITNMKTRVLYEIRGHMETHNKYGTTFEVESYAVADTLTQKAAIRYLSGATFPGIGRKTAEMIVDYYQDDTIRKIKRHPESLREVPNLPPHLAEIIIGRLKQSPLEDLRQTFFENNLSVPLLEKITDLTNDSEEIRELFVNDFYSFARNNNLKPIAKIDEIALFFGEDKNSPNRIGHWAEAVALQTIFNSGHTYLDLDTLKKALQKRLNIYDEIIIRDGLMYAKKNRLLYFEKGKIYPRESWEDEETISQGLADLLQPTLKLTAVSKTRFNQVLKKVELELGKILNINNFHFDDGQIEALRMFLKEPVLIVSGGPGTGKSTLIYGFILLYRYLFNHPPVGVATPTGRASARLKDIVEGLNPSTIHKLLEANENGTFGFNEDRPLNFEFMVLDEMSMVDNHVFAQFLKAKGPLKKLVLIGDFNQLPPVNYGNLFAELATNKNFAFIKLKTIHRQQKGNGIIDLASHIENGTLESLDWHNLGNVETYFDQSSQDNYKTLQLDYQLHLNNIEKFANAYQIITPFYAGSLGIENLNNFIQASFNPALVDKKTTKSKTYHRGFYTYALNDKVMCLKNNSEQDLTNGEIGTIQDLSFLDQKLHQASVKFGDHKLVNLTPDQFDDLALGYACSVHKTQGSEYQRVVLILESSSRNFFLNRKLIYTAITRAKEELLIIGDEKVLLEACKREPKPRFSTLGVKIEEKLQKKQQSKNNKEEE